MGNKEVKKFNQFIKEATDTTGSTIATPTATDTNITSMQNNVATYNKYKSRITSMFNGVKPEDMEKVSKDFENFINGLSDSEKGASDTLRTLFSSEKIKVDIKGLEAQKILIDQQIEQRMKDLKQISDNLR